MKYFGTDGFRGVAGTDLTVEHAYKIGRFIGWYYGARQGRKARIVVGKDTRRSSYMLESGMVSGLVASGADAYMLHVIPTPGLSYETTDGAFDCGVMITASHNPYTDNGIKLVNSQGFKMEEPLLQLIEQLRHQLIKGSRHRHIPVLRQTSPFCIDIIYRIFIFFVGLFRAAAKQQRDKKRQKNDSFLFHKTPLPTPYISAESAL